MTARNVQFHFKRKGTMEYKTLHEVCLLTGATRRAIQGYELQGLVKSTCRNKYGHLLYDEEAIERIKLIKLYQSAGCSLKEITKIMNSTDEVKNEIVKNKIETLKQKQETIQELIKTLTNMICQ